MPLVKIDTTKPLKKIEFLVTDLIPFAFITFIAAKEGTGKTAILTALAWQMTRPTGRGSFLDRPVARSRVIYLNTDAPDQESRPVRFWLERHARYHPDGDLEMIEVYEPSAEGITREDITRLEEIAASGEVALIIVDSFMGTFGGVEANRLDKVMPVMVALRELASKSGAAVIVTDHLPKKQAGENLGDRGPIGSVAKGAQARAVHVLTSLEPKEVDGRTVIKWTVHKQSFARRPEPFGLEIRVGGERDDTAEVVPFDLPESSRPETGLDRAIAAVTELLIAREGEQVRHAELLDAAVKGGNIRDRRAKEAVKGATSNLGDQLEVIKLAGRGSPLAYIYRAAHAGTGEGRGFPGTGCPVTGEPASHAVLSVQGGTAPITFFDNDAADAEGDAVPDSNVMRWRE